MEAVIPSDPASPRIAPLERTGLNEGTNAVYERLYGAPERPAPDTLPITAAVLLRHPSMYERYIGLARELMNGALPARYRELAVLRNAWILQAPFEWGEHVLIGKAAGLTSEEIERVTAGSGAAGWDERDRAILRAAEELHADTVISDETWAQLASFLSDEQLIELPIVVGWYALVAFAYNSLRMPLRPENEGLSAR